MSEEIVLQTTVVDASKSLADLTEMPPPPSTDVPPPPPPAPASPPTGVKVPANAKGRTDANGRPFDPDLHEVDKQTGNARLRRDGKLTFKRGNNFKARDKATVADSPPDDPAKPEAVEVHRMEPEGEDPVQRCQRAAALVNVFEKGSKILLGPDWELEAHEREEMTAATDMVFEKYSSIVLPPEGLLALALGGIVLTRLGKPETQKRLGRIRDFLGRGGVAAPPKAPAAPPASPAPAGSPPGSLVVSASRQP